MNEWINRLRHFRSRGRFEGGLDDEIRFHLENRCAELEASGLSSRDARAQARREFGSVALAREESRAAWRFGWLEDLAADLRHALRGYRRSPAFTLTALLSLALGIGGATAIYTALDAVLWKPAPVADPNRLVGLAISLDKDGPETDIPGAFVSRLRKSDIFAGLTISDADGLSFTYDGRAERIFGEIVSPDYFEVLGVGPLLGQGFTPEVRNGHWAAEAVLSYNFWKRRFAEDPGVIGRTIHLNTYPFTIVGVSPPSFSGLVRGTDYELRIPILPDGQELGQIEQISGAPRRWLNVVARLKPGVTISQAQAAADAQFQEFLRTTTDAQFKNAGLRHLQVVPGVRGFSDEYLLAFHTPLYVLLALVAIVLLIVCSNVANMLLARAAARAREFAIRTSIGAGRFRLIRQMLAESVLLAIVGGAVGLALAYWLTDVLYHFLPQGHIHIVMDLHPDSRALIFAFVVSLLTGMTFGLAPSLEITRGNLAGTLKNDSNASTGAARGARFRKMLVISQVAFSLVLLIAAGIFVKTLSELRPSGYRSNPDHILLFTMKPQKELYSDERRRQLAEEVVRRMSVLPGVRSAALAENGPLGSRTDSDAVAVPGQLQPVRASSDIVTPGFFDTVGIPRIAGRDFDSRDRLGAPLAVIVNQALVRDLFPNQNPIGRSIKVTLEREQGTYEIVGVVTDTHYYDVHKAPGPFVWFSMMQVTPYMPTLHVRINTADTAGMVAAVRREFDLIDQGLPVFNIRTMALRIEDSLAGERMVADLSGAFGMLALALAAVGLYGILAYSLSRRTREIGIRMALGARPGSVLWLMAREAFLLVGVGSVFGLGLAIAAFRILAQYLVGVSSVDLKIAAFCTLGMFVIAAAAAVAPAIRGSRIDPLTALRHD